MFTWKVKDLITLNINQTWKIYIITRLKNRHLMKPFMTKPNLNTRTSKPKVLNSMTNYLVNYLPKINQWHITYVAVFNNLKRRKVPWPVTYEHLIFDGDFLNICLVNSLIQLYIPGKSQNSGNMDLLYHIM